MPSWFTLDFVALNWQPLLVALILGYVLGWLFTGIPNKRHANEAEDRVASADARMRKTERELTDVRREAENNKSRAAALQVDLDSANARVRDLEAPTVAEPVAEPVAEAVDATLGDAEVAEETLFPDARGALPAEDIDGAALLVEVDEEVIPYDGNDIGELDAEEWQTIVDERLGEDETQTMLIPATEAPWESRTADDVSSAFADAAQTPDLSGLPSSKDIALTEAYARVTTLQAELERTDAVLRTRQADVDSLRAELAAANATRHELESRLIRAREDVASELAVLASTMIKMKDDAIQRGDARIAALTTELDSLRSGGRQTIGATTPKPVAQIGGGSGETSGKIVVPQVTAAGWQPGPAIGEEEAPAAQTPDMAKAIKALSEEANAPANTPANGSEMAGEESVVPPGLDAVANQDDPESSEQA